MKEKLRGISITINTNITKIEEIPKFLRDISKQLQSQITYQVPPFDKPGRLKKGDKTTCPFCGKPTVVAASASVAKWHVCQGPDGKQGPNGVQTNKKIQ